MELRRKVRYWKIYRNLKDIIRCLQKNLLAKVEYFNIGINHPAQELYIFVVIVVSIGLNKVLLIVIFRIKVLKNYFFVLTKWIFKFERETILQSCYGCSQILCLIFGILCESVQSLLSHLVDGCLILPHTACFC